MSCLYLVNAHVKSFIAKYITFLTNTLCSKIRKTSGVIRKKSNKCRYFPQFCEFTFKQRCSNALKKKDYCCRRSEQYVCVWDETWGHKGVNDHFKFWTKENCPGMFLRKKTQEVIVLCSSNSFVWSTITLNVCVCLHFNWYQRFGICIMCVCMYIHIYVCVCY